MYRVNPAFDDDTIDTNVSHVEGSRPLQAISIQKACKCYGSGKHPLRVLKGLNMDVARGSIFALLGPSGCGKTTLLSCILALRRLDSGSVNVYGTTPGTEESGIPGWRVGYMPQETALYREFTIRETFFLFGRIYALSNDKIIEKMDFLLNFLQMPKPNRSIKTLSTGQQRRVSFAVALLHEPELLVLDEPTVGVDPILRKKIWDHLVSLTSSGKATVLITTHYIEEARQAHKAGFMNDGTLIAQASPQHILTSYEANTLEEVFYKLVLNYEKSQANDVVPISEGTSQNDVRSELTVTSSEPKQDTTHKKKWWHTLSRINAIHMKSYSRLWKNPLLLAFMLVFPVLAVLVILFVFREKPSSIPVGVYNGEHPLDPICSVANGCLFSNLSCLYLNSLDSSVFSLVSYEKEDDVMYAVDQQDVRAAIVFPANYSDSLTSDILGNESYKNNSKIVVDIDKSNFVIALAIRRELADGYSKFINTFQSTCELGEVNKGEPILFPSLSSDVDFAYSDFQVAGMMMFLLFFFTCVYGTAYFIADRREGVIDRMIVSGVTVGELVCGLMLHQCAIMLVQLSLMFLFIYVVFQATVVGSVSLLFSLTALQGICAVAFGTLVAACITDDKAAFQVIILYEMMSFFLSGMLWPIEVMPSFVRYMGYSLASSFAITAGKNLAANDYSFTHVLIWPGFLSTILWTVVFIALLCFVLHRSKMG